MAKKQYYCIDYRNMHNAIHGLIVFTTRKEAEEKYSELKSGIQQIEVEVRNGKCGQEDGNIDYNLLINYVFDKSANVIDEVNFRNYEYAVIRGNKEKYYNHNGLKHIVVNLNSIDLYL